MAPRWPIIFDDYIFSIQQPDLYLRVEYAVQVYDIAFKDAIDGTGSGGQTN